MAVIQKKVCLLGTPGVGKTSLVRRFVESLFSERYQATVGVKIDRKVLELDGTTVSLILWDLQGEERFEQVRQQYLRGAAGYLLVADGTRPDTLATARAIAQGTEETLGPVPSVFAINKLDLRDDWAVSPADVERLRAAGRPVHLTSAKSGEGVDEAFAALARLLLPT